MDNRRRVTVKAGPGQVLGHIPKHMDGGLIDGIADILIGHWAFQGGVQPRMDHTPAGECPLCYGPLYKPLDRPVGRMAFRMGYTPPPEHDLVVMIDVLPADMDVLGCMTCVLAYVRPKGARR